MCSDSILLRCGLINILILFQRLFFANYIATG
jgi:hypothetical protein